MNVRRRILLGGATVVAVALALSAIRDLEPRALAPLIAGAALLAIVLFFAGREIAARLRESDALRATNERLQAEIASRAHDLGDANARLRSIIDSAVDGIIVIDARGRIEAFNPGAQRLFGYPEAEVIGRNVSMLMPSPDHEQHDGYLERYLTTGKAKIIGLGREVAGRRRDGSVFPLHLSVGEMAIGGDRKFTGILHDLSARVVMETQLREHTALARLGEMAAVIAHEVKNPLAGIRGAIEVIRDRLPDDAREKATVKEIVARIDALNELMKDLLLFARPPKPRPVTVDVLPLLSSTADLLRLDPALEHLRVDVQGTAPSIPADPEMLRIVFQNLLMNGAHAMQGRGTIHVAVGIVDSACRIAFADTGPGIPPDVRDKIFTPFFTTKARGSGLGLATAKRLVDAHHGQIDVSCPPAGGTIVTVQLPTLSS
jgi:two-component system sensor kinase FixL